MSIDSLGLLLYRSNNVDASALLFIERINYKELVKMNVLKKMNFGIYLISLFLFGGCEDLNKNSLVVSRDEINFGSEGGEATLILQTDAPEWKIQNPADWVTVSPTNGTDPSANITLTVDTKKVEPRSDVLTVIAGNADPIEVTVSQAAADFLYDLSLSHTFLSFKKGGESRELRIVTDAPDWEISSTAEWLQFSPTTGSGTTDVTVTAVANDASEDRETTISVTAEHTPSASVEATQIGEYYPDYNTNPLPADDTGMLTAVEVAADMRLGWNIGNTLEASGGETAWGNPQVTEQLILAVKANGFNTIRIPCSWNQYLDSQNTAKIKDDWLDRVKQVVEYCLNNDLYAIVNIHWDGGWLENNVTPGAEEEVTAKQIAFWQQIATHLRDFDGRLLFASANEPHVEDSEQMTVLNNYHQAFIDAVRATGGKNANRVLIVQGPSTDIEKTNELWTTLPRDPVPGRMMSEVHFYPYQFTLMTEDANWGKMFYYWGEGNHSATDTDRNPTWGEEDFVDDMMGRMNVQFVQKGIPVLLGEFGAIRRNNLTGDQLELHLKSRAYYLEYVTRTALANGVIPVYWDNGGSDFALFNRNSNTVSDQQALDGLIKGATE